MTGCSRAPAVPLIRLRSRRARWAALAASVVILAFVGATARLFVWPTANSPERSDAIVVLGGGPAARLAKGISLARAGFAPVLIISQSADGPVLRVSPGLGSSVFAPTRPPPRARLATSPTWPNVTTGTG